MKIIIYITQFVIIVFLITNGLSAQQSDVQTTLATMKNQIAQRKAITVNDESVYASGNGSVVVSTMQQWLADSLSQVRSNSVVITGRLAIFTKEDQVRTKAIDLLFKACSDKDQGIGELAIDYLKQVKWQYFTDNHRTAAGSFLNESNPLLGGFLYLAGYIKATAHEATIERLTTAGNLDRTTLWQAYIALARLGNKRGIESAITIANATPLGDGYIRVIVPGLIYTRQKACTDVLVAMLKNNEKACTPPNPDYSGAIPCRYRIVEALASVIVDFPVKVTSEGDLVSDDYEGALHTAIKWFYGNRDYKFID